MLHSATPDAYEPTYDVQHDLELEISDEAEGQMGTQSFIQKDKKFRVGFIACTITLRRNYTRAKNYDFTIQCVPNGIDPHWSLKFEITYKIELKTIGREINETRIIEANDGSRSSTVGPFEAEPQSPTDARLNASIKLINWTGIHLPLRFDFSTRTNLNNCTLIVEGKRLFVIKSILALQCGFFRRLFDEDDQSEIKILNVRHEDMVMFLTLIYPHTTSDQYSTLLRKTAQFDRLLDLASRFECPSVSSLIEEIIINRRPGEKGLLLLADKHCLSRTCSQMLGKLQTRTNYKMLLRSAEYANLSEELRSHLLDGVINKMSPVPRRRDLPGSPERHARVLSGTPWPHLNHSQLQLLLQHQRQLAANHVSPAPSSMHVPSSIQNLQGNLHPHVMPPPSPSFVNIRPSTVSHQYPTVPRPVAVPSTSPLVPSTSHLVPSTSYVVPSTSYVVPSTSYVVPSTSYVVSHSVPSTSHVNSPLFIPSSSRATIGSSSANTMSTAPPLKRVKEEDEESSSTGRNL